MEAWPTVVGLALLASALYFSWEVAIHLVHPVSRAVAIATLGLIEPEQEVNPNYLSLRDQIELAIQESEVNGVHVKYSRSPSAIKTSELLDIGYLITRHEVGNILQTHELDGAYFKYMSEEVIKDRLSSELTTTVFGYGATFDSFDSMAQIPESGFNRRQTPEQDIADTDRFVEEQVLLNQGKPLESWKVLTYWLMRNEGNFGESIQDTAIYYKAKIRHDKNGNYIVDENDATENVDFFITNFIDQTSLVGSFNENNAYYGTHSNNTTYSTVERISLIYDAYIQASILSMFPPSVDVAMTEAQMWGVYDDAGAVKAITNISSVMEVYRLDKYLQSLPD